MAKNDNKARMGNQVIFFIFLILTTLLGNSSFAQNLNDSVLFRINGRSFTVGQFTEAYRKNNIHTNLQRPVPVKEYLEMYVNFQLKVHHAMSLGMDTTVAFREELSNYRAQLAQSYLTDRQVTEHLLHEAYQRMQYDIRASHILVSVSPNALPADTLYAWNRIRNAQKRVLAGERFEDVAIEVSDDPFVRDQEATANRPPVPGNRGDLGFFTVFDMVYPFETAAFQTPVGEMSQPVRSDFGYHLIKVTERLPAMGRARVAHIMKVALPYADAQSEALAKEEIFTLHKRLLAGEDFSLLASQYSDDRASAANNGIIPVFTSGRMVPEFISAISTLESTGSFSQPVRTDFGWHLIKLLERTPPPSFEEIAMDLSFRVGNDDRSDLSQRVVIDRLKTEYQFFENKQNLKDLVALADSAMLAGNLSALPADMAGNTLFSFAGKSISVAHFGYFLSQNLGAQQVDFPQGMILDAYRRFVDYSILEYENSVLEQKYPEFRNILQEFHDGILFFKLKDQKVWSRAIQDTTGMRTFFNENRYLFQWPVRIQATILSFPSRQMAQSARRALVNANRAGSSQEPILIAVNDSIFPGFQKREGKFTRNQDGLPAGTPWRKGISRVLEANQKYEIVIVHAILPAGPQRLEEVRGKAIAEYQAYLESKWIQDLREKYQVTVNWQMLRKIRP